MSKNINGFDIAASNGDLRKWLNDAEEKKYAIPAFNFNDCWDLMAIVSAAEEEEAPVIVSSGVNTIETLGIENCAALGHIAKKNAKTPVFLHMDHTLDILTCKKAVDLGYDAVMIDASAKPLQENINLIKEITSYAHSEGVIVEGEIGRIRGADIEGTYLGTDFLADPQEAKQLVKESSVDLLAVGVGTQHGFYKGKPEINMRRLEEIDALVDVPLVLHGGTGIPEEDVREAIKRGIRKVNVSTIIRCTYMESMRREIEKQGSVTPPGKIVQPVLNDIKNIVKLWIHVCRANGRI